MRKTADNSRLSPARSPAPARPAVRQDVYARAVGSFVPKLTRKAFEKYGFSAASLITDWSKIAGPALAAYTEPERLKWPKGVEAFGEVADGAAGRPGATLVLRVDPARALDVQYQQARLIERINAYFGYRAVASLRILQVPMSAPRRAPLAARAPAAVAPSPEIAQVADDGLRAALERMHAGLARRGRGA